MGKVSENKFVGQPILRQIVNILPREKFDELVIRLVDILTLLHEIGDNLSRFPDKLGQVAGIGLLIITSYFHERLNFNLFLLFYDLKLHTLRVLLPFVRYFLRFARSVLSRNLTFVLIKQERF
jgi:hypothetical protein